ncbi:Lysophospholipase L1 [Saccharopolyspora antimicrobica]|uniref:Lysophospholipase L1 n=1 Tax=Saccharopolyspora antimicrobica TaxID=455193 RepID=A0A1I4VBL0_9PSEU|nr:GDSL-type esterase/lipase family protein [Saccharopolyspora antimicrobica]RKT86206.1 lysophospholipase L1-like esterase [Saccharopolyspora antimicrobica]SFM98430.1 Lysophospholipase L1 [Saccharopolyspora antimicrobica]
MRKRIVSRKRVIASVCVVLAAALGVTGVGGYSAFLRSPDGTPAEACGSPRPAVVAAGASITRGTLGGDWIGSLRSRSELAGYEFVNAGINGNTSADLLARIDTDVVACRPVAVTILVGTNDVRDGIPLAQYRANLAAIIGRIQDGTDARIALMSLPPMGEDLNSEINRRLSDYNRAIEETAASTGADYLPVHERMAEIVAERENPTSYDFSFPLALSAAIQHYAFGRSWDDIADVGGRELLVDHIHLSDRGAVVIAELAAGWLSAMA